MCFILDNYYELKSCEKNSVDPDQQGSSGSTLFKKSLYLFLKDFIHRGSYTSDHDHECKILFII